MPQSLVTLERVTSDRTMTDQTTTTLGTFLGTPGGLGRFRNVLLTDGNGNPAVVRFTGGVDTLRMTGRATGNANDSIGILLWNYFVLVPVPDPGVLRPIVSTVSPPANANITPSFQNNSASSPARSATIANRDTSVNTNTIVLMMNGAPVAKTVTPTAGGAEVSWSLSVLPPTRVITNTLTYQDSQGTNLTFTWTYSYPFLSAANRLPFNALTLRGFDYRMVQTDNTNIDGICATLGNNLNRAENQLAIPPTIPFERTYQTNLQTLTWNDANSTVPGLDPNVNPSACGGQLYDNIAVECFGYIQLTAGAHRFSVSSDDGFLLRSGATLRDPAAVVLGGRDGGTYGGTFDFIAEADGLYPARCVWYENGGGANFTLNSVNLSDDSQVLVNDPTDPPGVVKVFYPVVVVLTLQSSATVNGPYTTEVDAVINTVAKTITVARSGSARFYRISATTAKTIVSAVLSGPNIVLTYSP